MSLGPGCMVGICFCCAMGKCWFREQGGLWLSKVLGGLQSCIQFVGRIAVVALGPSCLRQKRGAGSSKKLRGSVACAGETLLAATRSR